MAGRWSTLPTSRHPRSGRPPTMPRRSLRRGLLVSLVALLVIPIVLVIMLGTSSLLAAVGDAAAVAVCGRISLGLGIIWSVTLVLTAALSAVVALTSDRPRHRGRGRRRRPVRRLREE